MSIYTAKTGVSSILKSYSPAEREKAKTSVINKVRFQLPKDRGLIAAIDDVLNYENYTQYHEFILFLTECQTTDDDLLRIISDATKSVQLLTPTKFPLLVEAILSINWLNRNNKIVNCYTEFLIELLIAHNKYSNFVIHKLIMYWIPDDASASKWINANPDAEINENLKIIHNLLGKILNILPLTFDIVTEKLEDLFPYYKKPPHVVGGFVHNILWLLEYKPNFMDFVLEMLLKRILLLDVNAPRNDIEDAELDVEDVNDMADASAIFHLEGCNDKNGDVNTKMFHPVGETLDICMVKIFEFSMKFNMLIQQPKSTNINNQKLVNSINYFKLLLNIFDNVILPSHNTHHVQFVIFHYCSFKLFLAEKFLSFLWSKLTDLNVSAPIRQAAVGYIASFLARAKFISITIVKHYLSEMCSWAHQYIERIDSVQGNNSLKANSVFFSVCQAIFYIIAFRSRNLTADKKGVLFLQSLQLSALVTSKLNPLRVCLPAVATAFAGVTRAYQLVYCHTILERNARRKLATVYSNDIITPDESLDTFFPYDPYLLKKSGQYIIPLYLQYQASEAEEESGPIDNVSCNRRKRGDSEMNHDDIDDFITEKRLKNSELSKSNDKEIQFTYGLSPGFYL